MTKKKKISKGASSQKRAREVASQDDVALQEENQDEVARQEGNEVETPRQVHQLDVDEVAEVDYVADVASSPQGEEGAPHQTQRQGKAPVSPMMEGEGRPEQEQHYHPAAEAAEAESMHNKGAADNEGFRRTQQRRPWASLFKDNRKTKLAMNLNQYEAKGGRLAFDYNDIDNVEDAMGFCLVGCFMGRHPGRDGVRIIGSQWKTPYKYFMHKSGWVVYKFDKEEDREKVLQGGPYFVFGIPMFLKIMPKCFLFDKDGRFVPAWIQIHGLPPDCWTQKVLSMIGSEVGKPLYTDSLTRTRERLDYARLMIEIPTFGDRIHEVPITLPTGVHVDLKIIYEMVPDYCQRCKKMGHGQDTCSGGNMAPGQQNNGAMPDTYTVPNANANVNMRQRSQSVRGRERMRSRYRSRQQWRPTQQQRQVPNGEQPVMQNDLAIISMDLPIPIDIEPPLGEINERQETHQTAQDQIHQEGQQEVVKEGGNGAPAVVRPDPQPSRQPALDESSGASTSASNVAASVTIGKTSEASTSSLPSATASSANEEAGTSIPIPISGRNLRARAARRGVQ